MIVQLRSEYGFHFGTRSWNTPEARDTWGPFYISEIENPICLDDIQEKFYAGKYRTLRQLEEDLGLISGNCRRFNNGVHPDDVKLRKLADSFDRRVKKLLPAFQTVGAPIPPSSQSEQSDSNIRRRQSQGKKKPIIESAQEEGEDDEPDDVDMLAEESHVAEGQALFPKTCESPKKRSQSQQLQHSSDGRTSDDDGGYEGEDSEARMRRSNRRKRPGHSKSRLTAHKEFEKIEQMAKAAGEQAARLSQQNR